MTGNNPNASSPWMSAWLAELHKQAFAPPMGGTAKSLIDYLRKDLIDQILQVALEAKLPLQIYWRDEGPYLSIDLPGGVEIDAPLEATEGLLLALKLIQFQSKAR